MTLGGSVRLIVVRPIGVDDAAAAGSPFCSQEMSRYTIEHAAEPGVAFAGPLGQTPNLANEHLVALMPDRPLIEERRETARRGTQGCAQSIRGLETDSLGCQVGRPAREETIERCPRDQPPLEQRRQALARPRDTELREDERDIRVGSRLARQDPERVIERVFDETRDFGLVRQVKTGVEIRFERKLPQERQAERVNRADGNVTQVIAQLDPSRPIEFRTRGSRGEFADNALAHLGGRFSGECDRKDVGWIDSAFEEVDIASNEDRRLARPRRRLEDDIVRRIDRERSCARVGIGLDHVEERELRRRRVT